MPDDFNVFIQVVLCLAKQAEVNAFAAHNRNADSEAKAWDEATKALFQAHYDLRRIIWEDRA